MRVIGTHYDRLGIRPDASADEVRFAYRRLARQHHPDAHGGEPSDEMAEINAAWRVLSDPARRAMYDASLRNPPAAPTGRPTVEDRLAEERYPVAPRPSRSDGPPRFPVLAIAAAVIAAMVVGFVASGLTDRDDTGSGIVDPIMHVGDCVVIEANNDARKVACEQPHDGEVTSFVPFGAICPGGTVPHRDRQGMGVACVTLLE